MITSNSEIIIQLDEIDKILGTPSSQRVFRILVCWKKLTLKELVQKANFSESQVHSTLTQLERVNIIKKASRGVYTISKNPFVDGLTAAYHELLVQHVGMALYQLNKEVDSLSALDITKRLDELIFQWQPILEKYYEFKMSSLINYSLDLYKEE